MATAENSRFESALRKVIAELKAPKGQYNSFGKYNYRNAEDILEALKPLLNQNDLRLKASDEVVQIGNRYYVKCTVTVIGHGEQDSATGYARESEIKKGMDESQITGASSSYAKKYALNDMFDIDDTKDADSHDNSDKGNMTPDKKSATTKPQITPSTTNPASDSQKNLIRKLAKEAGWTDEVIDKRLDGIKTSAEASESIGKLMTPA